MVCIPCIVIPFLLWVFHKYIQPIVVKFWPWKKQESVTSKKTDTVTNGEVVQNGHIENKVNGITTGTPSTDTGGTETKKDK